MKSQSPGASQAPSSGSGLVGTHASDIAGFTRVRSDADFTVTVDRLMTALIGHGLQLMARVNHTAADAKIALRPTEVLMIGSPRIGSPLMQIAPTLAIDLPLRALIWTDDADTTWIGYNDAIWTGARHGLDPEHFPSLTKMASTLCAIARFAAGCEDRPVQATE